MSDPLLANSRRRLIVATAAAAFLPFSFGTDARPRPATDGGAPMPEPLLAIPVLEIELDADGGVRHVSVQRRPSQAPETVQLAIDAVHRAAPFGSVAHLPRPWKFSEVFLFRDDRRFKPRSLDP